MRFGLQPVTRRGVEIVVPVHPRYQWGYTYGGLEICGNKAEFLHTDGVSQEATAMFYQQLAESEPESAHIIIADGAGFHLKEGDERMPSNVITRPAYSPELNPIEKLWDIVKDRICNRVWPDLEQLRAAIYGVLQEYWTPQELVRSLLGSGTVPSEANTTARTVRRI
jgi:transposase